jgi:biopolymer transport protein ExbD
MSMSTGGDGGGHGAPKADINTTPLVDVMLVLLIIFMITAPLMADKVKVELPTATSEVEAKEQAAGPKVTLSIVRDNALSPAKYYWGEQLVTPETLAARMRSEGKNSNNKIRMKIRASKGCRYEDVSAVLKLAKNNGIQFVSFVSAPQGKS